MKYGKEFQQILENPHFPEDWRTSAIEYRKLKKLIKDVVAELSSMGLSPDVLNKLLVTEEEAPVAGPSKSGKGKEKEVAKPTNDEDQAGDDGDVLEFEFESDESPLLSSNPRVPAPTKEVLLDPILDDDVEGEGLSYLRPERRDSEVGASSFRSGSPGSHPHHRKFRLRLLSEANDRPPSRRASVELSATFQAETNGVRPMGVTDLLRRHSSDINMEDAAHEQESRPTRRVVRRAVVADGHGGVKAEYVLTGEASHPVPQLRLHLSASPAASDWSSLSHTSRSPLSPTSGTMDDTEDDGDDSDEETTPKMSVPNVGVIPPSPQFSRMQHAASPIWALATGGAPEGIMQDLSLDDEASVPPSLATGRLVSSAPDSRQTNGDSDIPSISTEGARALENAAEGRHSPSHERDFIIPLASDMAFFNLLTAALTSLSTFHAEQQLLFRQSVDRLCLLISQSISPSSSGPEVLATPFTPSPGDDSDPPSAGTIARITPGSNTAKYSKKDLYAWREIFTLWIESEIFESSAERTRGERTVDEAEKRLQGFANEVVKRGLGDRRTMKGKKVRESWEEFLRLNVLLLDLKRFQMANINAARKILKKHDKRTALTASTGFQQFVRSTLSAPGALENTWSFYNTSLPHVLLASLTDVLLPILPSLDDYACLICTSIAFKPIRLACGHLFCVRCLVKMQKAGKGECPLCRANVVLLADKTSLDVTLMNFLKTWFPKEVRVKQRENESEVAREQARESGVDTRCVVM